MKRRTQKIINDFFNKKPEFSDLKNEFNKALDLLLLCVKENKILVCGNGGSAADSDHISGELLKSFCLKRKITESQKEKLKKISQDGEYIADNLQCGIKCIPLTSFNALNTAFSNDCKADLTFAQLVNALGTKGDVLIAISTSGNSKNVCYAADVAKSKGIKVISLTGKSGGKLKSRSDVLLNVNGENTYEIQEMHLPLYHLLCISLESEAFSE